MSEANEGRIITELRGHVWVMRIDRPQKLNGFTVKMIREHKGLEKAVGLGKLNPGNLLPGSDAADFNTQLDHLKGQAFLIQFDKLRGAGAITAAKALS